ncbi:MarR family transcriptional regulator [Nonomuraea phyllanthi]|uniref:MarR family transcriptional regulator n=1 Tax=Nonomuraea phyllanthi TaxID=2219224 RepID=A0A5C4VG07_9ACTN|nr:MarR family transcriptional regulator [Nonomuraea phyllanthi]KAB8188730.1 MarR family transcriptional regulator [Nonomuraea phyllanthi]
MSKDVEGQIGVVAGLVRSAFLVDAVYADSAREYGLTQQQGQLLCVLMPQPYGMSELGATLGLAKSSLTGLVDRSERNGLVQRKPDPHDSRAVRVALTRRGAKLADEFYTETCRRIEELTAEFAPEERAALAALLARVVADNKVPSVFMEPDLPR